MLRPGQCGQALIIALILVAMGGLIIIPALATTNTGLKHSQIVERHTLEAYAADSGVEYALCKLSNSPSQYVDSPLQETLDINDRSVSVTAEYVGGGLYRITSKASSGSTSTTVESYINVELGIFTHAVSSQQSMVLISSLIDSYPESGDGDIHSNEDIDVKMFSVVNGDASAVGAIQILDSSEVTGYVTEGAPPLEFPAVAAELYLGEALSGGTHFGNLELYFGNQNLGPLYIDGDLRIIGADVILQGTVYVTGNIDVTSGSLLGGYSVVSEGNINIQAGAFSGVELIPILSTIYGDISVQAPGEVSGVLFAPEGTVSMVMGELYGAVAGRYVNLQGVMLYYATELQGCDGLPGRKTNNITYNYK